MRKFTLSAAFVLAIGLFATSCDQAGAGANAANAGLRIAYVNTDSVLANYTFLNDEMESIQQREQVAGTDLQKKAQAFQQKVQSFQRRAQSGNMTPKQISNEEQVLGREQQELALEEQTLTQQFQMEAAQLQNKITDHLLEEVERLQDEQNYDYVLSYGSGAGVLAVNETYNLTDEVIERMNGGTPPAGLDSLNIQ